MNTDRWTQLKSLFDEALAQQPEQRVAFIEQVCDDEELRREAISLLTFHDDDPGFMEQPLREDALRVVAEDSDRTQLDERIGPYRLVRKIGRGGMGTVYLAERADGQFEQRVAIKLVRHGLHLDDLLERLRHERQILATLQHPNIARLLGGGGTDDGLPYLVMEYVEGLPIDQYCDQYRLSIPERLQLFRTVCAAVHYAHQNLIVHRDLKPSNILVIPDASGIGSEGHVKLLDFGIAKLMDENAPDAVPMTRTGMRAMTPEYASPEQVRGETVTTASDVYALGVVLYELLAGQRPYQVRNLSSTRIEQIICETEPPKPSTAIVQASEGTSSPTPAAISQARSTQPERLHRRLRGDLDIIVMAALRKEPARRYSSAQQLSEDIRRHLAQLPIAARPETLRYQVSTFVQRHTVGVVATGLVVLALVGGIVATAYQARVAAAARDRAEQRFDDVRSLANTMLFDLHDAIRDLPGATPARQMLVRQAHAYLDTLARDVTPDVTMQRELAEAYTRVGEIQGDPHFPNLGDITAAIESYEAALDLRQALWRQDSTDIATRHALANSYGRLAVVKSWGGANAEAITLSQQALALLAPLDATDPQIQYDKGRIRSELGWWYVWAGKPEDGLQELAHADSLLTPLAAAQPRNLDLQIDYWRVFAYRSDAYWFSGNLEEALRILDEEALPHTQDMAARFPGNPRAQGSLHTNLNKMANLHQIMGQYQEALARYRAVLPIAEAGVVADSADSRRYVGVASIHQSMGEILVEQNKLREARPHFEQALAIRQRLYERDPNNGEVGYTVASTLQALCSLLHTESKLNDAIGLCEKAATIQEAAVASDPQNAIGQEALYDISVLTARIHAQLARQPLVADSQREHLRTALDWYDRSLTLIETLKAQGVTYTWNTPPDTVRAERAALAEQ